MGRADSATCKQASMHGVWCPQRLGWQSIWIAGSSKWFCWRLGIVIVGQTFHATALMLCLSGIPLVASSLRAAMSMNSSCRTSCKFALSLPSRLLTTGDHQLLLPTPADAAATGENAITSEETGRVLDRDYCGADESDVASH